MVQGLTDAELEVGGCVLCEAGSDKPDQPPHVSKLLIPLRRFLYLLFDKTLACALLTWEMALSQPQHSLSFASFFVKSSLNR